MLLKNGVTLKGNEYRILRTLGQGGFGITYEAVQTNLDRRVAIKEFFMKDCCERGNDSCSVSVPTQTNRSLVDIFKVKFIREAKLIASFNNPHIVRVIDIFEENGTAYYVMEYLPGGSLSSLVKDNGPLSEEKAEFYIRQVSEALNYIHSQNTVHLDVKPSNILLNAHGDAVLIDFGLSKHYDEAGEQTTSTPVGVSKGYAPLEQGRDGDVSQFQPATDIYSLGATLYYLVTGMVPPEASIVYEEGLSRPKGVSDCTWGIIKRAMEPKRKDRPQSIGTFLQLYRTPYLKDGGDNAVYFNNDDETTIVLKRDSTGSNDSINDNRDDKKKSSKAFLIVVLIVFIFIGIASSRSFFQNYQSANQVEAATESINTVQESKQHETRPQSVNQAETAVGSKSSVQKSNQHNAKPQQNSSKEIPGSISITSTPAGAKVKIDNKDTKRVTPCVISELSPGKHRISISLDGYLVDNSSITISSGKESRYNAELTRLINLTVSGSINGHNWADLGLSVKWATSNVGASSPNKNGAYYAWGETRDKAVYEWENYKFRLGGDDAFANGTVSKYCTVSKYGKIQRGNIDNIVQLEKYDDAASYNWGSAWRIPTESEWRELLSQCAWELINLDGKDGYLVTSQKNGNSIFLPLAGAMDITGNKNGPNESLAGYWSSTLDVDFPVHAMYIFFSETKGGEMTSTTRAFGLSIRPVSQ